MHSTTLVVFVVLAIPYAALAISTARQFDTYCQKVARATGRSADGVFSKTDEDGNTPLQGELLRKLRTREYKKLADPLLVAQGAVLARRQALTRLLMVGWVLAVIATELWLS